MNFDDTPIETFKQVYMLNFFIFLATCNAAQQGLYNLLPFCNLFTERLSFSTEKQTILVSHRFQLGNTENNLHNAAVQVAAYKHVI